MITSKHMKNTTKRLLIFIGVWVGIVIVVLSLRLFSVQGLLIIILSFLILALILGVLDLILYIKIRRININFSKDNNLKKALETAEKFSKLPLTKAEKQMLILTLIYLYQVQGNLEKISDLYSKYPVDTFDFKRRYAYYLLKKDYYIIRNDKEGYLNLDQEERIALKIKEDEDLDEKRESLFYFSLQEGYVDYAIKDEVLNNLKNYSENSIYDCVYYHYILYKINSLEHKPFKIESKILESAKNTWLYEKILELENN